MATRQVFGGKGSGYLTPDPFVLFQSDESGKTKDAGMDALAESGYQTPRFIREVNVEALQSKLERLQTEIAQRLRDSVGPPPGLFNRIMDTDTMKVAMSTNFQPPYPAFAAVPPPPVPHPELQSVRNDRGPALNAQPMKSHMISNQVVSKGSVGHPFKCAPACRYVKRKGGCQDGENCTSCHHCFWSKAHANAPEEKEDARLKEAKTLANRPVSLLGGEEPFGVQAQEAVKPEISLGTMGHPHTCAEPCKYVKRKGGCMHGKACTNCHACVWSRSLGQKTQAEAPGLFRASYGDAMQERQDPGSGQNAQAEAPSFYGTSYGVAVQEKHDPGSIISRNVPTTDPYAAAPLLSTNPAWGQPQALPKPQGAPKQVSWCPSAGSTGHPYSCGPACKYAMKAKGCKDGAMCDHCHLCRWMRYG